MLLLYEPYQVSRAFVQFGNLISRNMLLLDSTNVICWTKNRMVWSPSKYYWCQFLEQWCRALRIILHVFGCSGLISDDSLPAGLWWWSRLSVVQVDGWIGSIVMVVASSWSIMGRLVVTISDDPTARASSIHGVLQGLRLALMLSRLQV